MSSTPNPPIEIVTAPAEHPTTFDCPVQCVRAIWMLRQTENVREHAMPSWILGAIDHRSEIWNTYLVQRVVVAAADEREARAQIAGTMPAEEAPNPWLDRDLTSCDEIMAPDALAPAFRGAWASRRSPGARAEARVFHQ
jgi:hypothetical protein